MTACAQTGCSGAIEDGYCDACGMAAARSTRTSSGRTPSTRSSRSTRSTRTGSTRTGRGSSRLLGSRPLARPPLPPLDPLASIVPGVVPERKRFCSSCDSTLKRDSGFCAKCGQEYSFVPTLAPGDMVVGKYEIKGTTAFGGLGWIYLALDTVLNRWVILKGLLNSKDPKMLEVAVKEREFLASVKHPNIVSIYDFITHGNEGFIVMEYVNGKTLMTLRKENNGPLPVAEAISYIAEILPALGYLDEMGLVYCDFKPENVMVEEESVKLIDLGAVRRIDDLGGDIYGSRGYTAPEAHDAPTPLSDLYSAARALAVLVAPFEFQGKYQRSLPPPEECAVFQANDALYRFLLKATRTKPEERFQSAAEMSEQLVGVLRGIVGESGDLGRIDSTLFEPDSERAIESVKGAHVHDELPKLKVDRDDSAASIILAASALPDAERRLTLFERAKKTHATSLELALRIIDELITLGMFDRANDGLEVVQVSHPTEWRLAWYRGRALLAQGKTTETLAVFEAIAEEFPGELAPKQALARTHENFALAEVGRAAALDRAIAYYDSVSKADSSFTSAAIGLARCLDHRGDRAAAAEAYRRVPATSNRFAQSRMELARLLVRGHPSTNDLLHASGALEALEGIVEGISAHELRAEVLAAAATSAAASKVIPPADLKVLGVPFTEAKLRLAAEAELRTCARYAETSEARITFVDRANAVRPLTLT